MAKDYLLYSGLTGPILFFILLLFAVQNFPGYNPYTNYLSDLGVPPESGWFFNSSLVLSGLFGFLFGYSLRKSIKVGAMLLMTGSLFLVLVSIFTLKSPPMHFIFAGIFFITTAAGLAFVGNALRPKKIWVIPAVSALFSIIFVVLQTQILEHIAVASINISLIVLSFYFINER